MLNAAQMALDEVKGQVAGYKIELVSLDDASLPRLVGRHCRGEQRAKAIADEQAVV